MGRMPSAEAQALLRIARESIEHGLRTGRPLEPDVASHPPELRERRATFVTLRSGGLLRGCTGTLEAGESLVESVAHNAWRSAFRDPRFPKLDETELTGLELHVSILTPPEPLPVESERDLLEKLRPGVDGLVLEDGPARATFLPSVWDSVESPEAFVAELKQKAGLPRAYWSLTLRFERYTVEEVP